MSDLRDRIERLYDAHPRGRRVQTQVPAGVRDRGQTWLARMTDYSPQSVRKWIAEGKPSRRGEFAIRTLEREAGLRNGGPEGSPKEM